MIPPPESITWADFFLALGQASIPVLMGAIGGYLMGYNLSAFRSLFRRR